MNVNPEVKIDGEYWFVLQRLKEESLRTKTTDPIEYWIYYGVVGGEGPTARNEERILKKLEELGAIEIISSGWEYE